MPVSTGSCIFFTLPIWAALQGWLILKESISLVDIVQLIVAFIGVVIINNPFAHSEESKEELYTPKNILIGSIFAITGAISGSLAGVCMRYMNKDIHYSISPFWFAAGNCFFGPLGYCFI